jgi:hypothetical protein
MARASAKPAWRYQHHGRLGSTALVLLAEDTVKRLGALGIPLLPGNRAARALEIIQQSHDHRLPVSKDHPEALAKIAAAIRDTWEFQLIARALPQDRNAELDGKIELMLRGSRRSEMPRDFQFELLVGAMFAMAGIEAEPAEPDLRFKIQGKEWGLAAKRVRSGNQLGPRTTKAREQLEEQCLRGVIAVNVDAFLQGVPATGDPWVVGAEFDRGVGRLHRLLPTLAGQQSLLGIMAIGAVAGWEFDGDLPRISHPLIFQARAFSDTPQDQAVTDELFIRLESGIEQRVGDIYRMIAAAMPAEDS